MKSFLFILIIAVSFYGAFSNEWHWGPKYPPLPTVLDVNLTRYMGTWYEIARLNDIYEDDCYCIEVTFKYITPALFKFNSTCRRNSEESTSEEWIANASPTTSTNAQYEVWTELRIWPFTKEFSVIALDKDYQYAMVAEGQMRNNLWIYSREPQLDPKIYRNLVKQARDLGFPAANLILVPQLCESQVE